MNFSLKVPFLSVDYRCLILKKGNPGRSHLSSARARSLVNSLLLPVSACFLPRLEQRELVNYEEHGHRAWDHPDRVFHPRPSHPGECAWAV